MSHTERAENETEREMLVDRGVYWYRNRSTKDVILWGHDAMMKLLTLLYAETVTAA